MIYIKVKNKINKMILIFYPALDVMSADSETRARAHYGNFSAETANFCGAAANCEILFHQKKRKVQDCEGEKTSWEVGASLSRGITRDPGQNLLLTPHLERRLDLQVVLRLRFVDAGTVGT